MVAHLKNSRIIGGKKKVHELFIKKEEKLGTTHDFNSFCFDKARVNMWQSVL